MKYVYTVVLIMILGALSALAVVGTGVDINHLRTVSLSVAAIVQTLFVLFYATFSWYKTFLGRALFLKAVTLMAIVDFAALSRWFDFGANDTIFVVLYATLTVGIVAQFVAFIRVRLSGRSDQVSGNAPTHEERRW